MCIKLIYEDTTFAVFDKPAGLPSAPLNTLDTKDTALTQMGKICPEILTIQGKKPIECGLVHRIDTATRGLLLVAKTQMAFNFFQKEQTEGRFIKYYTAFCYAQIYQKPPFSLSSSFRAFGPHRYKVAPVTSDSGKAALKKSGSKIYTTEILEITPIAHLPSSEIVQVVCKITQGYRHQVRAHLAWAGLPVIGDKLYCCSDSTNNAVVKKNLNSEMQFFATGLEFFVPPKNNNVSIVKSDLQKPLKIMLPLPLSVQEFF
jgi:23S rRNA pseudouridine1911/1915/1917 synthase